MASTAKARSAMAEARLLRDKALQVKGHQISELHKLIADTQGEMAKDYGLVSSLRFIRPLPTTCRRLLFASRLEILPSCSHFCCGLSPQRGMHLSPPRGSGWNARRQVPSSSGRPACPFLL